MREGSSTKTNPAILKLYLVQTHMLPLVDTCNLNHNQTLRQCSMRSLPLFIRAGDASPKLLLCWKGARIHPLSDTISTSCGAPAEGFLRTFNCFHWADHPDRCHHNDRLRNPLASRPASMPPLTPLARILKALRFGNHDYSSETDSIGTSVRLL